MLTIASPVFGNNGNMPARYTCDGENVSPPLIITSIPTSTQSLALVVDDPGAPSGNFTHWVLGNIAPEIHEIAENTVPPGATEGVNSSGNIGYTGPCPSSGQHRYRFKIYALDTVLETKQLMSQKHLEDAIHGHIIEWGMITALYER